MASLTWQTWVWASSGSWWWAGKPGVLQSMQRVGHDWATELTDWSPPPTWNDLLPKRTPSPKVQGDQGALGSYINSCLGAEINWLKREVFSFSIDSLTCTKTKQIFSVDKSRRWCHAWQRSSITYLWFCLGEGYSLCLSCLSCMFRPWQDLQPESDAAEGCCLTGCPSHWPSMGMSTKSPWKLLWPVTLFLQSIIMFLSYMCSVLKTYHKTERHNERQKSTLAPLLI